MDVRPSVEKDYGNWISCLSLKETMNYVKYSEERLT